MVGSKNCAELRSFRRGCMALPSREDNVWKPPSTTERFCLSVRQSSHFGTALISAVLNSIRGKGNTAVEIALSSLVQNEYDVLEFKAISTSPFIWFYSKHSDCSVKSNRFKLEHV